MYVACFPAALADYLMTRFRRWRCIGSEAVHHPVWTQMNGALKGLTME